VLVSEAVTIGAITLVLERQVFALVVALGVCTVIFVFIKLQRILISLEELEDRRICDIFSLYAKHQLPGYNLTEACLRHGIGLLQIKAVLHLANASLVVPFEMIEYAILVVLLDFIQTKIHIVAEVPLEGLAHVVYGVPGLKRVVPLRDSEISTKLKPSTTINFLLFLVPERHWHCDRDH